MECLDCMDSDGALRHFPLPGARREQPAFDMDVLRIVRQRWVELMNEKINPKGMPNGNRHHTL